jgi:sugar lactone lactonase YvrE
LTRGPGEVRAGEPGTLRPALLKSDVLRSVASLPPHLVGMFEEPIDFQQAATGVYYVFDRRAHAIYTIDPARTAARKAVDIGQEAGRIIQPFGFDVAPDGSFVVADVPRGRQRVQTFSAAGDRLGGFFLPGQPAARVTIGNVMLNGVGSIQHTGTTLLISHPESGALFTEYSLAGYAMRSIGSLRQTGFEQDRELHLAMNAGLPLVDPTGGYFYVFLAGRPVFRKYDAKGTLVYERLMQGREIDELIANQPTRWPRRQVEDREVPFVSPIVHAAAVDPRGRLWVSFATGYTYVFDADGDRIRAVQFSGAGIINPTSLSFTRDGRLLITPGCYEFDPG